MKTLHFMVILTSFYSPYAICCQDKLPTPTHSRDSSIPVVFRTESGTIIASVQQSPTTREILNAKNLPYGSANSNLGSFPEQNRVSPRSGSNLSTEAFTALVVTNPLSQLRRKESIQQSTSENATTTLELMDLNDIPTVASCPTTPPNSPIQKLVNTDRLNELAADVVRGLTPTLTPTTQTPPTTLGELGALPDLYTNYAEIKGC